MQNLDKNYMDSLRKAYCSSLNLLLRKEVRGLMIFLQGFCSYYSSLSIAFAVDTYVILEFWDFMWITWPMCLVMT